ncbi:tripartite tricarboxylate transporter substrate binding protein [Paenibacillus sp. IB182496]|uniref:Tripartite tricarboxylate transporter substrate binding protein n=1 Tax=Paenibacillus sabuli TaxID=2772509 RepID=A0A927BTM9_9BACL|nr:tripartite tricarboxylate transporter substrate binding protein [Paenibacillus sabuli]MBD2846581.1 tripartite tricarboxylate transporter substrate binding protein [Paenibacillus sabuli]
MRKRNANLIRLIAIALIALSLSGCTLSGKGGDYPSSTITGVVPWGAGGGTDLVSRTVVSGAQEALGKNIVMMNKTGASGTIGQQYVYDQKADGYTLLFNTGDGSLYPVLGLSELTYKEFTPIYIFARIAGVVVVSKDSPYDSIDDLLEDAKANPDTIKMGVSGVGGLPWVASIMLNNLFDTRFSQITFDGDGPLITALLGDQIDVTVLSAGSAMQYLQQGDFKGLAVISNEPIDAISDVPALGAVKPEAQSMLETTGPWFGVFVKKETPEDVVAKLTEAFKTGYENEEFQTFLQTNGYTPLGLTGEAAWNHINAWQSQQAWLIHDAGKSQASPEEFDIPRPAQ